MNYACCCSCYFTPPGMLTLCVAPVDLCRTSGSLRVTFAIYCALTACQGSRTSGSVRVTLAIYCVLAVCQAQHACAFHCLCCSVTKSCPTLWDPMDCSTPGFPVLHYLLELSQTYIHWVSDVIQSSYPLSPSSSLTLNLPRIRVFSNELAVCIRWPKYWSLSFSISPSKKYSGLISFKID